MNEELEKLKSLLYTDSLTQYGKRKLIKIYEDIIKKKDKQIDLMTEYIDNSNYVDSEECQFQYDFKIKKCIEKGDCKDCIKQYFESKSKEE